MWTRILACKFMQNAENAIMKKCIYIHLYLNRKKLVLDPSFLSKKINKCMCVGGCWVCVRIQKDREKVWKAAHKTIECAHYGPGQSGSPPSALLSPGTQWPHSSACPTSLLMTAARHSGREWTTALHSSPPCHQLLMSHFCSVRRNDSFLTALWGSTWDHNLQE